jgi:hypothetical protein
MVGVFEGKLGEKASKPRWGRNGHRATPVDYPGALSAHQRHRNPGGSMRAIFKARIIALACLIVCLFPLTAYAYTDPNMGSFIYQLLFPIITGISIAYLAFKKNVNNLIFKIKSYFKEKTKS